MISKTTLQSIISKYYLNTNESVKWVIDNNNLSIDFMSPTREVIGKVNCNNFPLEDSKLAIYDTKKLSSLISICNGDLLLELEKSNQVFTKLKLSDLNFNLTYALSDHLLIGKDVENLIKAKSALSQVDNMLVTTTTNLDGENVCEFIFGDESGHNNKITYQVLGEIKEEGLKIPFNSDMFKTILHSNKDMEGGILQLSSMGLMNFQFSSEEIESEYFMLRKAESEF
jgi:hypothetical protein